MQVLEELFPLIVNDIILFDIVLNGIDETLEY